MKSVEWGILGAHQFMKHTTSDKTSVMAKRYHNKTAEMPKDLPGMNYIGA